MYYTEIFTRLGSLVRLHHLPPVLELHVVLGLPLAVVPRAGEL